MRLSRMRSLIAIRVETFIANQPIPLSEVKLTSDTGDHYRSRLTSWPDLLDRMRPICRHDSFNRYHNRNPSRFWRRPLLKYYNVGGLIMTKLDDAERKIIREWDAWASNQSDPATLHDGFPFYRHLLKERSELLKFRYTGDKWQRVYGCLLRAGRVKE